MYLKGLKSEANPEFVRIQSPATWVYFFFLISRWFAFTIRWHCSLANLHATIHQKAAGAVIL